jgi:acetylornithine deacetylase/succinyl-diaminopimelate desuccinylase-like protein
VFGGRGWAEGAFSGKIEGPWLYGRGAFDMKSVAIAQLLAVEKLLADLDGARPKRSVIVLATTGEEHGSDLGTRWILHAHPELTRRFAVVLTEGGAVEGRSRDELKYWGTEVAQKRLIDVRVCSSDRRPLAELEREMRRTGGFFTEPEVVPEVARFMRSYAPTRDAAVLRRDLGDLHALLLDRPRFDGLSSYLKSYFVNEAVPQGIFELEDGWMLRIHVLLLPGADPDEVLAELLPPWVYHGLAKVIYDPGTAPHGSSPDHWAFRTIDRVMAERFPHVVHGPLVLPSTLTDARFLRAAGIPTFGFTPFDILTPEVVQLRYYGTVNERISLPGYVAGADLYGEVLRRLVE